MVGEGSAIGIGWWLVRDKEWSAGDALWAAIGGRWTMDDGCQVQAQSLIEFKSIDRCLTLFHILAVLNLTGWQ